MEVYGIKYEIIRATCGFKINTSCIYYKPNVQCHLLSRPMSLNHPENQRKITFKQVSESIFFSVEDFAKIIFSRNFPPIKKRWKKALEVRREWLKKHTKTKKIIIQA